MKSSRDSFWELVLAFHRVNPRDWTQVLRLGGKNLHPLSHLAGPYYTNRHLRVPSPKMQMGFENGVELTAIQTTSPESPLEELAEQTVAQPMVVAGSGHRSTYPQFCFFLITIRQLDKNKHLKILLLLFSGSPFAAHNHWGARCGLKTSKGTFTALRLQSTGTEHSCPEQQDGSVVSHRDPVLIKGAVASCKSEPGRGLWI